MNVYLEEIQSGEEKEELKKKLRWISIKLGWFPMLMAFIPIVGWLMLPMLIVIIVIGFQFTQRVLHLAPTHWLQ